MLGLTNHKQVALMRTETVIKAVDSIAKVSRQGRQVNGLFRLMTNPEVLWKQAYANIYSNKGAITKGVNSNTLDGFSEERVNHLIRLLVRGQYCPKPVRRTYIPKKNGKLRPLGIPTGDDKLVHEVVKILLERVYEPVFSDSSHGFRPRKSCHTALRQVCNVWHGTKWIIEFDIKGFFDNINHRKLIELLEKKIDDKRIINIVRKMLKAGYTEDWQFNNTWSGTPQGGVISPVLANIYLHELDMFMENMMHQFSKAKRRKSNPAYDSLSQMMRINNQKLSSYRMELEGHNPKEKASLLQKRRKIQHKMREIPSVDLFDPDYRRLRYVRYADDFIIGVIGSRNDAEEVMQQVKSFIENELLLEIADEKTCIRSAKKGVRFLGYDAKIYSGEKLVKLTNEYGTCVKRTMRQKIQVHIPQEKLLQYASKNGYGDMSAFKPVSRPGLLQRSDLEILLRYNGEMRGLVNYYSLAQGYKNSLSKLIGLAQLSLFATLAHKHNSSIGKIMRQMQLPNKGGYGLRVIVNGKPKLYRLFRLKDHTIPNSIHSSVDNRPNLQWLKLSRTELVQRINANYCEYCGKQGGYMEVHHIRAMKDVLGKAQLWQLMMNSMNRKTMVLCIDCHRELHSRNGLPNWRAKVRQHP
jgi:group II intron reverse transcriptase/maturase